MVKLFFAAILFGFIAIAVIVMVVINFTYKSVKKLREEAADAFYRNQKMKEQKEKNPFDNDYFKSNRNSRGRHRRSRTQAQYEEREQPRRENPFGEDYFKSTQQESPQADKKDTARKTTTTSSGVTIIDDRDAGDKRKIFDHSDGEYVEFTEVEN